MGERLVTAMSERARACKAQRNSVSVSASRRDSASRAAASSWRAEALPRASAAAESRSAAALASALCAAWWRGGEQVGG